MADYSQYGGVSPDWEAYMAQNPQPALPPGLTPLQLREMTNQGREAASNAIIQTKSPAGKVEQQDYACPTSDLQTVPIRVYRPAEGLKKAGTKRLPVYIYFHGGGFLFGTLTSEDAACHAIVEELGIVVVNVCYRHTPEWEWPTQAHDAFAALNWVFENMQQKIGGDETKVIVGGRSAGANLAAGVVLREKDVLGRNRIQGQLLAIPLLCHSSVFPSGLIAPGKSSYEENANAPILPLSRMELFETLLGPEAINDRYYNLVLTPDEDVRGLPPAHFMIAGRDILRDEGLLYMEKLKSVGVQTDVNVYPGVPHGFRRFDGLEASRQWDIDTIQAIKRLLKL